MAQTPSDSSGDYFTNARQQRIFCKYWNGSGENEPSIKVLVFIVHGLCEHCQRYNDLALKVKHDLDAYVFSHDHQGHGLSEGQRVMVDTFLDYTADIVQHTRSVRAKYPGIPLYLLAHSMGGLIAVKAVQQYPDEFQALVNISPALYTNPVDTPWWKVTLVRYIGTYLPWMPIAHASDPKRHNRRNKDMDKDYNEDINVHHGYLKANWAIAFLECLESVQSHFADITIPVLTLHGDDDDVCPLVGSERMHASLSSAVKELKVYPGAYHELHTEPDGVGQACIEYLIEWMRDVLQRSK